MIKLTRVKIIRIIGEKEKKLVPIQKFNELVENGVLFEDLGTKEI